MTPVRIVIDPQVPLLREIYDLLCSSMTICPTPLSKPSDGQCGQINGRCVHIIPVQDHGSVSAPDILVTTTSYRGSHASCVGMVSKELRPVIHRIKGTVCCQETMQSCQAHCVVRPAKSAREPVVVDAVRQVTSLITLFSKD